jgi:hypothetical protein
VWQGKGVLTSTLLITFGRCLNSDKSWEWSKAASWEGNSVEVGAVVAGWEVALGVVDRAGSWLDWAEDIQGVREKASCEVR